MPPVQHIGNDKKRYMQASAMEDCHLKILNAWALSRH